MPEHPSNHYYVGMMLELFLTEVPVNAIVAFI